MKAKQYPKWVIDALREIEEECPNVSYGVTKPSLSGEWIEAEDDNET